MPTARQRLERYGQELAQYRRAVAGGGGSGGPAIRLTMNDDGPADRTGLDRLFVGLGALVAAFPAVLEAALPTIRGAFDDVFRSEGAQGSGAWAPLRPSTQEQRRRLRYPPAHPILVRTGALRRHVLTTPARITSTGQAVELLIRPDPSVGGVRKYRALAKGYAPGNLPGRPMVAVGPAAAARITSAVSRELRARAAANGLG